MRTAAALSNRTFFFGLLRKTHTQATEYPHIRLLTSLILIFKNQHTPKAASPHPPPLLHQVTANLPHLLSTKPQPGIYNSPYTADNPPTAMGIPVEEHLRVGVKDLLKTRLSQKVSRDRAKRGSGAERRGGLIMYV